MEIILGRMLGKVILRKAQIITGYLKRKKYVSYFKSIYKNMYYSMFQVDKCTRAIFFPSFYLEEHSVSGHLVVDVSL
jgi:hypothetical protein